MSYSTVSYTGDGATANYTIPFPYLMKADVAVKVDGVDASFSWLTNSTIQISPAPDSGKVVFIKRTTPIADPYEVYNNAATLLASDLNDEVSQLLFAVQEIEDEIDSLSGGYLPDPSGLADNTILIVEHGEWTTTVLNTWFTDTYGSFPQPTKTVKVTGTTATPWIYDAILLDDSTGSLASRETATAITLQNTLQLTQPGKHLNVGDYIAPARLVGTNAGIDVYDCSAGDNETVVDVIWHITQTDNPTKHYVSDMDLRGRVFWMTILSTDVPANPPDTSQWTVVENGFAIGGQWLFGPDWDPGVDQNIATEVMPESSITVSFWIEAGTGKVYGVLDNSYFGEVYVRIQLHIGPYRETPDLTI